MVFYHLRSHALWPLQGQRQLQYVAFQEVGYGLLPQQLPLVRGEESYPYVLHAALLLHHHERLPLVLKRAPVGAVGQCL